MFYGLLLIFCYTLSFEVMACMLIIYVFAMGTAATELALLNANFQNEKGWNIFIKIYPYSSEGYVTYGRNLAESEKYHGQKNA